ncbi:MAG: Mrp/NBP35 family ATP-binding protein [Bacteroidaceae bacterium]|nr:Mrp/NBP35 family ATP-binding protein [Bacteroidaceae bacterium]MBP9637363.1 Mrp/NBP35 family ATP-binding protein [Bacteroidaceae bacterium]
MIEKKVIKGVKHCIIIASGKGGVGKSTVSANLAITLAKKGFKTALVDADIYGPSIPKIFGIESEHPCLVMHDGINMMQPIEKFGVKINSLGFFTDKDKAVIWRGPMASNAISQLFTDTYWGDIDYMIIDFPPGTSDVQITTVQSFYIDAAIIVTIPQVLALNDARKGAEMLINSKINIPLIGIVENMSWFTPQQHPEEKYFLFGKDGGRLLADEFKTSLIAQIPLIKEVGEFVEKGDDLLSENIEFSIIFEQLADNLLLQVPIGDCLPNLDGVSDKASFTESCEKKDCKARKTCKGDCCS